VRGADPAIPVAAEVAVAQIVGHEEDDVRGTFGGTGGAGAGEYGDQKGMKLSSRHERQTKSAMMKIA
jgi:hypothetical protein